MHRLTTQMATTAWSEIGQTKDPGIPSESPFWVASAELCGPSHATLLGIFTGGWIRSRAAKTQTITQVEDTGVTGGNLACLATGVGPCTYPSIKISYVTISDFAKYV